MSAQCSFLGILRKMCFLLVNSCFSPFCFKLSSTDTLNDVWFSFVKVLKEPTFMLYYYLLYLPFLSFLFMHIQLCCLQFLWLALRYLELFSYYIIKYLCHFDVKFPEVASMERHTKFGLYVYYLIYPQTLKTLDFQLSTQ